MTATSRVSPTPAVPADTVPVGSAGIERTLAGYLNLAGIRPADMPLGKATTTARSSTRACRSAA